MVLEKSLESPLDCRKIQPVRLKGNHFWILIGKTDAEASILWPPDAKNWLIGKDPDAGKDWRWEEKGRTEGKMVGWHHWLNGHEFEQAAGVGEGREAWQSMGSQRVWHNWATELNWRYAITNFTSKIIKVKSQRESSLYTIKPSRTTVIDFKWFSKMEKTIYSDQYAKNKN